MKRIFHLIILLSFLITNLYAQSGDWNGIYGYGISTEVEAVGRLFLYSTSDSTALFFLDLNRGAPSNNMGQLVGEIVLLNDSIGKYSYRNSDDFIDCAIMFKHKGQYIDVYQATDAGNCGFGFGVYALGKFGEISIEKPISFIAADGEEIKFENYDWKSWWK